MALLQVWKRSDDFSVAAYVLSRYITHAFCNGTDGGIAQLGERSVRNAEVRGSIPLASTNYR